QALDAVVMDPVEDPAQVALVRRSSGPAGAKVVEGRQRQQSDRASRFQQEFTAPEVILEDGRARLGVPQRLVGPDAVRRKCCDAQVHRFEWCDDFAAARNRALDLADANWNLVLDADEWLVEGGAWLAGLPRMERQLGVADVQSLYEMGVTGSVSRSRITRLLPRGVRYQGVVHEQPVSDLPRVLVPLVIRHDGYLPEQMSRKQGRNQRLLLQEL
ncbi:MAG: hypothetical protein JNL58_32790, partial [Planctomyces sp.]|nr:hypothetical protein [Planctomyces sp.]